MNLVPVEPRLDDAGDRRGRRAESEPLERNERRAPRRALRDGRDLERPPEHVGEHLHPARVREQRAAGHDDGVDAADRREHVGEAVADAFERGLRDVDAASSRTRGP